MADYRTELEEIWAVLFWQSLGAPGEISVTRQRGDGGFFHYAKFSVTDARKHLPEPDDLKNFGSRRKLRGSEIIAVSLGWPIRFSFCLEKALQDRFPKLPKSAREIAELMRSSDGFDLTDEHTLERWLSWLSKMAPLSAKNLKQATGAEAKRRISDMSEEEIPGKTRNKLLELVGGLALMAYPNFRAPTGGIQRGMAKKIAGDLEDYDIHISEDVVLDYLREAAVLIPEAKD